MTAKIARRFVDIDGIRTHYLDSGEGPPVLLLHSGEFGGCAELSWEFVIPALAERFRVLAPDWLGFGHTDKVHDFAQGQARRIRHMRRFLEIMAVGAAHVAGNSMGGSIWAQAMAENPGAFAVRSLTLISSGGYMPDNEHRRTLLAYDGTPEAMRAMLRAMLHDPRWAKDEAYVARRVALSLLPGAWECQAAPRFKNPTVAARGEFGRADETPYERIAVPTLIIAGREDRLRLPGYAEELGAKFPRANVHVLDACGHCPNIERAGDVTRLMLEFLARAEQG
ncbi:MAG: alpha/beta fold hydrolase [Rhodospirillaceae bacterium]|nr:alpha/beta fold hydrolase [Rhodospirillaceae bacterium]